VSRLPGSLVFLAKARRHRYFSPHELVWRYALALGSAARAGCGRCVRNK
jgi:hypothetical protein